MIGRLAGWLGSAAKNRISAHAAASLICLGIILGSLAAALGTILRDQDGFRLSLAAMAGMLVAWRLASSRLRGGQAAFFIALLGAGLILSGVEGLSNKLFAMDRSIVQLAWSTSQWRVGQPAPDPSLAIQLGRGFFQALFATVAQTARWSAQLIGGKPAADPLASSLAWGYLIWCASAWATWATCRLSNPLGGVLPGAAVLAASLSFTWAEALYLVPVLGGALFLMALQNYFNREQDWQKNSLDFAEDLRFDASMWSLAFVVVVTFAAMLLSLFSPQRSLAFARSLLQPRAPQVEEAGNALGLEKKPANPSSEEFTNPGVLPRKHLLGSGAELSQRIVMLVQVEEAGSSNPGTPAACDGAPCTAPSERNYWRLLDFNLYTGRGWMTSATTSQTYKPNEAAWSGAPDRFRTLQAQVQVVGDLGTGIYASGYLITVDQGFEVFRRPTPEGEPDFFSARLSRPPIGGVYRVTSARPVAGPEELRASGTDYPQWVRDTYLQLPQKTPARLVDLARRLTQNQPDAYDRALAIESYVRSIPYSLDVPLPPADRDVVDYYLFDIRKGYCDYAASAMVVLARAAGLPSRLVIGYAPGRFDPQNDVYVVTEAEAHSWAEVYFNGTGWIEFEPTGGQAALARPEASPPALAPEFNAAPGSAAPARKLPWKSGLIGLMSLLAGLALAWTAWLRLETWRLGRMESQAALTAIYIGMQRASTGLGVPHSPGDTPGEFAGRLGRSMARLGKQGPPQIFSPAAEEIRQLADLYAQAIYSPHPVEQSRRQQAVFTWKELRRRLWIAWIFSIIWTRILRKNTDSLKCL